VVARGSPLCATVAAPLRTVKPTSFCRFVINCISRAATNTRTAARASIAPWRA
jgi:hypothetical protein